jgi:hypothetical protein
MSLSLTLKKRDPSEPYSLPTARGLLHATPEQASIITAAITSKDNLIINALAGAAKTSTLEFICRYYPPTPILSLAFNKRIAEEMTKRLPPNVQCRTMNSLGHRVWGTAVGKRLALDPKKSYTILKSLVDALNRSDRSAAYEEFSDILKTIGFAKRAGYVPDASWTRRPSMPRSTKNRRGSTGSSSTWPSTRVSPKPTPDQSISMIKFTCRPCLGDLFLHIHSSWLMRLKICQKLTTPCSGKSQRLGSSP